MSIYVYIFYSFIIILDMNIQNVALQYFEYNCWAFGYTALPF